MSGQLTWDGLATLIAAGIAAVVVVIGYFVQQAIKRANERAEMYARAMQAIEDYVEAPYVIRRRDGSASARLSITRHLSEVQSRIRYFESAMFQDAPTALSDAYAHLVSEARSEAGTQMTHAWRSKPTRRDRDVPLVKVMPQPRIDDAKAKVVSLMAPGAFIFWRGVVGILAGVGVAPLIAVSLLDQLIGPPAGILVASLCASITASFCLAFLAYYWTHRRPRNFSLLLASTSAIAAGLYWAAYASHLL